MSVNMSSAPCCHDLIMQNRFTLAGQDSGIRDLCAFEQENYEEIYAELLGLYKQKAGEIPDNAEIQVINKFSTDNNECVSPKGLVNVSLEYLAKLLTFADTVGYDWEVDFVENKKTHFKNLYNCNVKFHCSKREFIDMAVGKGFRCNH